MRSIFYKSLKDREVKRLDKIKRGCWIHFDEAGKTDVEEASKLAGIEYADISESLDIYELPRIEKENGAVIIYVRVPTEKQGEFLRHTKLITLIITSDYIITISKIKSSFIRLLLEDPDLTTTQRTKFILKFFSYAAARYTNSIRRIRDDIVKKTSRVSRISNKIIVELLRYQEVLEEYHLALAPTRNIIQAIKDAGYLTFYEEDKDLLEDLQINIQQSLDICVVNLKNLVAMRDSYQIIFTNDLNRVIKFLTGFTIILTIPNIISGIYGMNVNLPLQESQWAFAFVIAFIIVSSVAVFRVFRDKNWI